MADLNLIYSELTNEIFRNSIFYIPTSILSMDEFKGLDIDYNSFSKVIDKLIYIDENFNFIIDENEFGEEKILIKASKFTENCFKIIDSKQTLPQESYLYIIDKYIEQLRCYTHISKILFDNFDLHSNKNEKTKSLFRFQLHYFQLHLAEVEKITGIKAQIFNPQNILPEVKNNPVFKKILFRLPKNEKHFRDFISHERNTEIESIILKKYPTIKGKKLRYIIDFLVKKEVLTITYGTQTELYNSLKRTFNCNIGTYPSIFGYAVNENKDSDYSRITNELETILTDYFKVL